jgi:hypothetical protein
LRQAKARLFRAANQILKKFHDNTLVFYFKYETEAKPVFFQQTAAPVNSGWRLCSQLLTTQSKHGVATLPEHAWERARHRAKIIEPLAQWRPFGVLTLAVQMQVLEAATTAIALIKSRTLFPRSMLVREKAKTWTHHHWQRAA